MLSATSQLLISGTAAVVGHASAHQDDLGAQLAETLRNLDSLLQHAGGARDHLGGGSLLKAYLRHRDDAAAVTAAVAAHAAGARGLLLLAGDICRSELLIEIDGTHDLAR
jgi:chorismate lyase/3-hydroxybenzoate synthase